MPVVIDSFGWFQSPLHGKRLHLLIAGAALRPDATVPRSDRYANNGIECDHGSLKARLRPMRGLKQDRSVRVILAGHAFVQNLRRGHYELAIDEPAGRRLAVAFHELALTV